jgi:hypothetical protein
MTAASPRSSPSMSSATRGELTRLHSRSSGRGPLTRVGTYTRDVEKSRFGVRAAQKVRPDKHASLHPNVHMGKSTRVGDLLEVASRPNLE